VAKAEAVANRGLRVGAAGVRVPAPRVPESTPLLERVGSVLEPRVAVAGAEGAEGALAPAEGVALPLVRDSPLVAAKGEGDAEWDADADAEALREEEALPEYVAGGARVPVPPPALPLRRGAAEPLPQLVARSAAETLGEPDWEGGAEGSAESDGTGDVPTVAVTSPLGEPPPPPDGDGDADKDGDTEGENDARGDGEGRSVALEPTEGVSEGGPLRDTVGAAPVAEGGRVRELQALVSALRDGEVVAMGVRDVRGETLGEALPPGERDCEGDADAEPEREGDWEAVPDADAEPCASTVAVGSGDVPSVAVTAAVPEGTEFVAAALCEKLGEKECRGLSDTDAQVEGEGVKEPATDAVRLPAASLVGAPVPLGGATLAVSVWLTVALTLAHVEVAEADTVAEPVRQTVAVADARGGCVMRVCVTVPVVDGDVVPEELTHPLRDCEGEPDGVLVAEGDREKEGDSVIRAVGSVAVAESDGVAHDVAVRVKFPLVAERRAEEDTERECVALPLALGQREPVVDTRAVAVARDDADGDAEPEEEPLSEGDGEGELVAPGEVVPRMEHDSEAVSEAHREPNADNDGGEVRVTDGSGAPDSAALPVRCGEDDTLGEALCVLL
jgi:hypothetical protein